MLSKNRRQIILKKMIEDLELPEAAYEKAINRYEDLGEWFSREESSLKNNDPHIFSQGSFRLGTATKPLSSDGFYDLDLSCKLRSGVTKSSHSQKELKDMVKVELESYKKRRGIQSEIVSKHRCWRLEYQDDLNFHMDVVPSVPESETKRKLIKGFLINSGITESSATTASELTCVITDDRHPNFSTISDEWKISNPEGYAKWFEERMNKLQRYDLMEKSAQVDDIPLFKRKSPLQRVVQLLKRHRDSMFQEDEEIKPISVIITTLAAQAYSGEQDIDECLAGVLSKMKNLVKATHPRVPNPVDPNEDFADRWAMDKYKHLKLEENFWRWLDQAVTDFELLGSSSEAQYIVNQADKKFAIHLDESDLRKSLAAEVHTPIIPKVHIIKDEAKPWQEVSI